MIRLYGKYYLDANLSSQTVKKAHEKRAGGLGFENATYHTRMIDALNSALRLTIRDIKANGRMPTSDEVQQIREEIVQAVSGVEWNMEWKEFYRWQKYLRDNDPVGDGGLNCGNTE